MNEEGQGSARLGNEFPENLNTDWFTAGMHSVRLMGCIQLAEARIAALVVIHKFG